MVVDESGEMQKSVCDDKEDVVSLSGFRNIFLSAYLFNCGTEDTMMVLIFRTRRRRISTSVFRVHFGVNISFDCCLVMGSLILKTLISNL